jgi:hypothetical protein
MLEIDSLMLVHALKSPSLCCNELGQLAEDILHAVCSWRLKPGLPMPLLKWQEIPVFERVWNKTLVSDYWVMVGFSYWLKKN